MKYILKWLLVLLVIFIGWIGVLYSFQEKFIFPAPGNYVQHPIPRNFDWEEVNFRTSDDVLLHGWWMNVGSTETVVFFHGNATNISYYTGQLYMLKKLGKNALFFDYRGYGQSEGKIKREEDIYLDGQAAIDFLSEEKHVSPQHITLWGFSVGTGVATEIALRNPVAALILEAPFLSVPTLAHKFLHFSPPRWLFQYQLDNELKISELTLPLLILHSPDDQMVPFSHGEKLFKKAETEKQFIELTGGHNNAISKSSSLYFSTLQDFLP